MSGGPPVMRGPRTMSPRAATRVATALAVFAALFHPAAGSAAVQVTLIGRMKLPNSVLLTNVVGYSDARTRREYALIGDSADKVYIVDVTDPSAPLLAAQIGGIPGFDVKTWDHYLYTCDGNTSGADSRIVDLLDPAHPLVQPRGFLSAHALQVSEAGILFAAFPGLRVFDLADPTTPKLVYETGGEGHDSTPRGDRLYDFHGRDGTIIRDVSDPSAPVTLGVVADDAIVFHHSGDVTPDHRFLYICDELITHPGPDVTIWDIANPASPARVGEIADAGASVHNFYVEEDLAYAAWYSAGFKVFDLGDPANPVLAAGYDTSKRTGEGFVGAIGAFVAGGGRVYVCDMENGLFVFTVARDVPGMPAPDGGVALAQNTPNPFHPSTRVPFRLERAQTVRIAVYDVTGRRVRVLVDGAVSAGEHHADWDGRDEAGRAAASGVYFCRLLAGGHAETRRMVLVR